MNIFKSLIYVFNMFLKGDSSLKSQIYGFHSKIMSRKEYGILCLLVVMPVVLVLLSIHYFINNVSIIILLLIIGMLYLILIYPILSYPYIFRRSLMPAYIDSNGQRYVILDFNKNKAFVVAIDKGNFKNNNYNKEFLGLHDYNKRYLKETKDIFFKYGVYYIKRN